MPRTNNRMSGLTGKRIVAVRRMTRKELAREGWHPPGWKMCVAIEVEGGIVLYASQDSEGNGPGTIYGCEGDVTFMVLPEGEGSEALH